MKNILPAIVLLLFTFYSQDSSCQGLEQAKDLHQQAKFTEALELSTRLLSELGKKSKPALKADLLSIQGDCLIMLHDYEQALLQLDQAQALLSRRKRTQAYLRVRNLQAKAYLAIGDCTQTRATLEATIERFERKNTSNEMAQTYDYLGSYWAEIGDQESAKTFFLKARVIREKNAATYPLALHETAEYLALIQQTNANYDGAIKTLQEGLAIVQEHSGNYFIRATLLQDLGICYREKGDVETALQYLEAAKDAWAEEEMNSQIKLAQCYRAIGATYRKAEEFDQAEAHFQKGQQLFESDLRRPFQINLGFLLHDYALLKINQKAIDEAGELLSRAADLLQADYKGCGWFLNQVTQIRSTKGDLLYYGKSYEEAILEYKRNIKIIKEDLGKESTFLWQPYNNLGLTYQSLSMFDSAMVYFDKALDIMHPQWRSLQQFDQAISPVDYAYVLWNKAENQYWNFGAGASWDSLKRSFTYYDSYSRFLDYMRGSYLEEASKIGFANINKIAYEKCIGVLSTLHYYEPEVRWDKKAFEYLEKSKSLVLLEAVKRSQVGKFAGISTELIQREQELRTHVLTAENRYHDLLSRLGVADIIVREAKAETFQRKKAFYDFLDLMANDHPDYHRTMHQVDVQDLESLQAHLSRPDQGILAYYEGVTNIYIFLITSETFRYVRVRRDFPLAELIDTFREGITAYHKLPLGQRTDSLYRMALSNYVTTGQRLYDSLVRPMEQQLEGLKELLIIPDGQITKIPFGALLSDQPASLANFDSYPFLLRRFRFSYCYSYSMLEDMIHRKPGHGQIQGVLGMAPFSTLASSEADSPPLANKSQLGELRYSGPEVEYIVEQEGGLAILGQEAKKARFLQECSKYRMLHLSSHAVADAKNGTQSYLAFQGEDGIEALYVGELYGLRLYADLVVLSACETTLGELEIGEGIISLARAFAYAGAKSILTTLWVVDDAAMKDLTIDFYKNSQERGTTKMLALHQAKLAHLQKGTNLSKHPYFWAAMIGVGDMSPLHP